MTAVESSQCSAIFTDVFKLLAPLSAVGEAPMVRSNRDSAWLCLHLTAEAFVEEVKVDPIEGFHLHFGLDGPDAGDWNVTRANLHEKLKPEILDSIHMAWLRCRLEGKL